MVANTINVISLDESAAEHEFIGSSLAIRSVRRLIETVAASDSTVLLHGETGTGKELVAKAIHEGSLRKRGPYIRLSCAAMPSGLLENELFGHERGAFTGAWTQTTGRFQHAAAVDTPVLKATSLGSHHAATTVETVHG